MMKTMQWFMDAGILGIGIRDDRDHAVVDGSGHLTYR